MFEMSRVMEIWVIVGLSLLAIMFAMSVLARLYRKAGPHEALIIYGFGGIIAPFIGIKLIDLVLVASHLA